MGSSNVSASRKSGAGMSLQGLIGGLTARAVGTTALGPSPVGFRASGIDRAAGSSRHAPGVISHGDPFLLIGAEDVEAPPERSSGSIDQTSADPKARPASFLASDGDIFWLIDSANPNSTDDAEALDVISQSPALAADSAPDTAGMGAPVAGSGPVTM